MSGTTSTALSNRMTASSTICLDLKLLEPELSEHLAYAFSMREHSSGLFVQYLLVNDGLTKGLLLRGSQ